ncbi:hypothetical protein LOK49_LG15G00865 [Camellia lanceoleosa]|uniref:Uncharacterized protein n=1 Tax=Camellia lanceoleosa TaxID=1840588 RepID=A0ACC0F5K2_9ERIC|nr:hypothetical protein LOK49_LG15G00865 [Camellia lanceoleosa]
MPESTHIAKPAASWLDDFLVWMSSEVFGCCRKFVDGSYCPPDDQVVLSMFGPPSRNVPIEREQELETSTLSHLTD